MEYRVVLKNPFRQAEVLRQLAGEAPASLWNPLGSTELLRPLAAPAFAFGLTPPAFGQAPGFATSLAPAYENADYALYLVSAKGGQEKDYYAVDQRTLVYDRQIKWAYWEPAVATDELEVTGAQLKLICPAASMTDINKHITHLNEAMRKYKINTRLRQAHFLAQVAHESDHFRTAREYASGAAYEGRKDLGNTQPGDGKRFRGRGLIQLTGRDVYKKYGAYINKDLTTDAGAKLVEEEPYASDASGWFWLVYKSYAKLNKLADEDNINRISAVVNGGVNGRAERIQFWKNAKKVFGIAEKSAT